MVFDLNLQTV